jgi:cytochrome P450
MIIVKFIILMLITIIAKKSWKKLKKVLLMHRTISSIPGPKLISIVGVALKNCGHEKMLNYLISLNDIYGSPVKFWLGPTNLVVIIDSPEDMKLILNSENCLDKASFYNFVNAGKALIAAKKEVWKVHSKILLRAFNKNLLESSAQVIYEESKELVRKLSEKTNGEEFDVFESVADSALEMIFKIFLDLKWTKKMREQYIKESHK